MLHILNAITFSIPNSYLDKRSRAVYPLELTNFHYSCFNSDRLGLSSYIDLFVNRQIKFYRSDQVIINSWQ